MTSHTLAPHTGRVLACLLAFLATTIAQPVRAQTTWELTPYQVKIVVAIAPRPELTRQLREDLLAALASRVDTVVGPTWDAKIVAAPADVRSLLLGRLAEANPGNLPQAWVADKELDKCLLLAVTTEGGGFRVTARDFDVRTQLWGTVATRLVAQREVLVDDAMRALLSAFAPIVIIEATQPKEGLLRPRAAALPPRDETVLAIMPGDVFRPILRVNDRDGNAKKIDSVDWTLVQVVAPPPSADPMVEGLPAEGQAADPVAEGGADPNSADPLTEVEALNATAVHAQIHSGLRNPLTGRRRGRIEQLGLFVRDPQVPTRLEIKARTAPFRPLAGYEVFAYGPDSKETILLGRSDYLGVVQVPNIHAGLRILVVKHGGQLLAKLPILPGMFPTATASIADDSQRLEVEGYIVGFQERFVDLVARRQVLLSRARKLVDESKYDEAMALVNELRELGDENELADALRDERGRSVSADPLTQAKVNKLFNDTEQVVRKFFNSKDVEDLAGDIERGRAPPPNKAGG